MVDVPFDYWAIFLGLVTFGFGLWEGGAIVTGHRERTLTYWLRIKIGVEGDPNATKKPGSLIFVFSMIAFTVWFVPHIVLGWWGGSP